MKELKINEEDNSYVIQSNDVSKLASSLIGTLYLRKGKDASAYEKLGQGKQFEVMDELLEEGKISHKEFYEANNFLGVASIASKRYDCTASVDGYYNFDWFMRFFDSVGTIRSKELQDLWAKVLAGEMRNPGHCSFRTLETLKNMSADEARRFLNICRYVVWSGEIHFVFPMGFINRENDTCRTIISKAGINYADDIILLNETGLMTGDHDLMAYLKKDFPLEIANNSVVALVLNPSEDEVFISQEIYQLTKSGVELFNIVCESENIKFDEEYFIECIKILKSQNPDIDICAMRIVNDKEHNTLENIDL